MKIGVIYMLVYIMSYSITPSSTVLKCKYKICSEIFLNKGSI